MNTTSVASESARSVHGLCVMTINLAGGMTVDAILAEFSDLSADDVRAVSLLAESMVLRHRDTIVR